MILSDNKQRLKVREMNETKTKNKKPQLSARELYNNRGAKFFANIEAVKALYFLTAFSPLPQQELF